MGLLDYSKVAGVLVAIGAIAYTSVHQFELTRVWDTVDIVVLVGLLVLFLRDATREERKRFARTVDYVLAGLAGVALVPAVLKLFIG